MTGRVRRRLAVALALLVAAAVLIPSIGLTQGSRELPNLRVTSATEPPDFADPGDRFRIAFTVGNEGSAGARRRTITRAYLSRGRGLSDDDVALRSRRTSAIRAEGQVSGRMTVTVPADLPAGAYYLLVCADATDLVDEFDDAHNCHISGQELRLGAPPPGPAGPVGPQGEPGPKGDPGPASVESYELARTVMELGTPNVHDEVNDGDPGEADEGSTQNTEVLVVGPFRFRTLCRTALPKENDERDDAKILVYIDEGTMAFEGRQGARMNVPAGTGRPGANGASGGEGQHQIIAAARDGDGGMGSGQTGFVSGMNEASVYLVHSSGWEVVFEGYAAVDTLGAGEPGTSNEDRCVFGGEATVVAKPAAR